MPKAVSPARTHPAGELWVGASWRVGLVHIHILAAAPCVAGRQCDAVAEPRPTKAVGKSRAMEGAGHAHPHLAQLRPTSGQAACSCCVRSRSGDRRRRQLYSGPQALPAWQLRCAASATSLRVTTTAAEVRWVKRPAGCRWVWVPPRHALPASCPGPSTPALRHCALTHQAKQGVPAASPTNCARRIAYRR